ncbi:hypothetical protein WL06_05490 [Burkholderia cepacia]|nr:hypothetical protein WL06_05490 [Burkholderia cepacia]
MKLCSFGHDKYKTDSESFGDEPNDAQLALHCKRQQQTSKGNFATGPAGGGGGGGGGEILCAGRLRQRAFLRTTEQTLTEQPHISKLISKKYVFWRQAWR